MFGVWVVAHDLVYVSHYHRFGLLSDVAVLGACLRPAEQHDLAGSAKPISECQGLLFSFLLFSILPSSNTTPL